MNNDIPLRFLYRDTRRFCKSSIASALPEYNWQIKFTRYFYKVMKNLQSPVERPHLAVFVVLSSAVYVGRVEEEVLSISFWNVFSGQAL